MPMKNVKKWFFDWNNMLLLFLIVGILVNAQLLKTIKNQRISSRSVPELELALIIKDSEDPFWKQFKNGADKAAVFYQASLDTSYLEIKGQNKSQFTETELLDKARIANVDGIISYISNSKGSEGVIDAAAYQNIPTITIENDVPNSKRASFVGYNAYRFGQEAGKKMNEILAGKGKIIIIMNSNENAEQNSQNLKISGFLNEINQSKGLEVTEYIVSENGIYGTKDIVDKLLSSEKSVQGIFITNSIDTESVAQLLIEYNQVGKYQVIGAGNSDEIKEYVEKKILYASVYVNAYELGYKCVETIAKIKHSEPVPPYIDTTIGVLTSDPPDEPRE
jgi:ribose transport system substrate-binding protein